jgi:hypothetical protein
MGNRHFKRSPKPEISPASSVEKSRADAIPAKAPTSPENDRKIFTHNTETKLPSYPPYSVRVYFENGKEGGRENLSASDAIAYAGTARDSGKMIAIEIYDRANNLVAAGSPKDGLRILRKLDFSESTEAKPELDPAAGLKSREEIRKSEEEAREELFSDGGYSHPMSSIETSEKTPSTMAFEELAAAVESFFEEAGKIALGWKFDKLDDRGAVKAFLDLIVEHRRAIDKVKGIG